MSKFCGTNLCIPIPKRTTARNRGHYNVFALFKVDAYNSPGNHENGAYEWGRTCRNLNYYYITIKEKVFSKELVSNVLFIYNHTNY